MKFFISFLLCVVFSIFDTEILKFVNKTDRKIQYLKCYEDNREINSSNLKVTHIQRDDLIVIPLKGNIDLCKFKLLSQNNIKSIVVRNFGSRVKVNTDYESYEFNKGETDIIYFSKISNSYRVFRIISNIVLLLLCFRYFKTYIRLFLPLLASNTIWLLLSPGSINFDVLGYISAYNSFPVIDDEFGIARLVFFFIPFSLAESVLYYKVFHLVSGVYSVALLIDRLLLRNLYYYISLGLVTLSPIYMSLYTSCTDMAFTSVLFIKIVLLIDIYKGRFKRCSGILLALTCVFSIFYRYNSIVLLPVDILFLYFLNKNNGSLKKIVAFVGVIFLVSVATVKLVPTAKTGYESFPILYELTDIYIEKKETRKELEWINEYVDIQRVYRESEDRSSLIKTFYSDSYSEEDRIDREMIEKDSYNIIQSYMSFFITKPLDVLAVKFKHFAYTIGFDNGEIEKHYFFPPLINWIDERGDFSHLSTYDLNSISSFFGFSKYINTFLFKTLENIEGEVWVSILIYLFILLLLARRLTRAQKIIALYPVFYLLSFMIFNHGFLLTYTYFIVILSKILLVYYISISKNISFLGRG